jgi:hypothetical protein
MVSRWEEMGLHVGLVNASDGGGTSPSSLASTSTSGGGYTRPDLAVPTEELSRIGGDAGRVGAGFVGQATQAAGNCHAAASALSAAGLQSGAALRHAMQRFSEKSTELSRDCSHIQEHLSMTTTSHVALEQDINADLRNAQATSSTLTPSSSYPSPAWRALLGMDDPVDPADPGPGDDGGDDDGDDGDTGLNQAILDA